MCDESRASLGGQNKLGLDPDGARFTSSIKKKMVGPTLYHSESVSLDPDSPDSFGLKAGTPSMYNPEASTMRRRRSQADKHIRVTQLGSRIWV